VGLAHASQVDCRPLVGSLWRRMSCVSFEPSHDSGPQVWFAALSKTRGPAFPRFDGIPVVVIRIVIGTRKELRTALRMMPATGGTPLERVVGDSGLASLRGVCPPAPQGNSVHFLYEPQRIGDAKNRRRIHDDPIKSRRLSSANLAIPPAPVTRMRWCGALPAGTKYRSGFSSYGMVSSSPFR